MVVRVVRVVCAVWCDSGDSGDGQGPEGCLVRIEVAVEAAMEGAKVTDPPSLRLGNAVLGTGQDAEVLEQRVRHTAAPQECVRARPYRVLGSRLQCCSAVGELAADRCVLQDLRGDAMRCSQKRWLATRLETRRPS